MSFINLPESSSPRYKDPVVDLAGLPLIGNVDGDVRVTKDTGAIYVWHEATTSWVSATGGAGLTNLNGQTGGTQTFAVGTSGTDLAISSALNVHTFNLPDASLTARGVVTTSAQTIAGDKTFNDDVAINGDFPLARRYQEFTLSGTDITNKSVTLSRAPVTPGATEVKPIGGIPQRYLTDFTVSGTTLSWNGLGLEVLLEAGDVLQVTHN